jgi:hypothetical protein
VPIYVYQTIDPSTPIRRLALKQRMNDEPLGMDPKMGEVVQQVICAGYRAHIIGNSTGASIGLRRRGPCDCS